MKTSSVHTPTSAQDALRSTPSINVMRAKADIKAALKLEDVSNISLGRMPTPINPDKLNFHLKRINYDQEETSYLVQGFQQGFFLGHTGEVTNTDPVNAKRVRLEPDIARNKIEKELRKGNIKGPFVSKPFSIFRVSPLKYLIKRWKENIE